MSEKEKMDFLISEGFKYIPETGECYRPDGELINNVGVYNRFTYRIDGVDRRTRVHRFAYYFVYGKLPRSVDHINRDKFDNRITNLRDGSGDVNTLNTERLDKAKGYWYRKDVNKYVASIKINYKSKHLGYFETEEEARNVYLEARKKLGRL
jgi:hypothetical protein